MKNKADIITQIENTELDTKYSNYSKSGSLKQESITAMDIIKLKKLQANKNKR